VPELSYPFLSSDEGTKGEVLIGLFNRNVPRDRPYTTIAESLQQTFRLSLEVEMPAKFRQPDKSAWLRFMICLAGQNGTLLVAPDMTYRRLILVGEAWELPRRRDHMVQNEERVEFKNYLDETVTRFREDCGIRLRRISR